MAKTQYTVVACAVATDVPVVLWGAPGMGKTAFVQALGRSMGLMVETVIASIHEPSDFLGLPVPDLERGQTRYLAPDWAVRLAEAGQGLLFLDEVSTAPPAVQAALLRVVLERRVGNLQLPSGIRVIAAANPPDQAAGGWEMSLPLANRFAHVTWELDQEEWIPAFVSGFPEPDLPKVGNWQEKLPEARGLIAAYLHGRPGKLLEVSGEQLAYPTPRSWEMASKMLAAALTVTEDPGLIAAVVGACVGKGVGLEVAAVLDQGRLPSPQELLADPEGAPLPERADRLFAALSGTASYVLGKVESPDFEKLWLAAWQLAKRAAGIRLDVAVVPATALAQFHLRAVKQGRVRVPLPPEDCLKPFYGLAKVLGGR